MNTITIPDGSTGITVTYTPPVAAAPPVVVPPVVVIPPVVSPPTPTTDGPNIDPADLARWGFTNIKRADPGDAVMLNPAHWRISSAHSQANGLATRNVDALAKYGQSYYGGPTDSNLHCSIAAGEGVWMVGDTMPPGKWIVEFSRKTTGRDATHAYGWGSGWALGPQGQEIDDEEDTNWGTGEQGYASSTYRSMAGKVINSYYNPTFPLADGQFHTFTLAWDTTNAKQHLIWDRIIQVDTMTIANPTEPMTLQVITGYVQGTTPPAWQDADNVYQHIRYYTAT